MKYPIFATLAANLRAHRKKYNLTQQALAQASGQTSATISALERGTRNLTLSSLAKIATALEEAAVSRGATEDLGKPIIVRLLESSNGEH
jgi:transcriptional regulator with XRE-family HTH domain